VLLLVFIFCLLHYKLASYCLSHYAFLKSFYLSNWKEVKEITCKNIKNLLIRVRHHVVNFFFWDAIIDINIFLFSGYDISLSIYSPFFLLFFIIIIFCLFKVKFIASQTSMRKNKNLSYYSHTFLKTRLDSYALEYRLEVLGKNNQFCRQLWWKFETTIEYKFFNVYDLIEIY